MGTASKQDDIEDATTLLTRQHREVEAWLKEYDALGERARVSKKRLADKICQHLMMHMQIEDEIFYPAVREQTERLESKIDEATVEHGSLKHLVQKVQKMEPDDDLYDAQIAVITELAEHHHEEEEEDLFPKVRKLKLDLVELGQQLAQRGDQLLGKA